MKYLLLLLPLNCLGATVSTQSKEPWSISKCDKFGIKAVAVFNQSIWNSGGFALWRVTCLYEDKHEKKTAKPT
jgi:hypothetical protein